jgi:molybdate transport system ATP-binding protein
VAVAGSVPVTAEVSAAAVADLGLTEGLPVWVTVKAAEVDAYPA